MVLRYNERIANVDHLMHAAQLRFYKNNSALVLRWGKTLVELHWNEVAIMWERFSKLLSINANLLFRCIAVGEE